MKVFKFGGASVKDAESVKNVANILKEYRKDKILLVVSAMDKFTNSLEELLDAYYNQSERTNELFAGIKEGHRTIMDGLFPTGHEAYTKVNDLWVEIDWILEEPVNSTYNYLYDQVVSLGELVSSTILSEYLNHVGITNDWMDARDVIITDERYREATVLWERVEDLCKSKVAPLLDKNNLIVTQGFIGATLENNTTTLGREGSDYTAAIFAYGMNAEGMWIWKDVPGILSADPKLFENVTKISRLTYKEAVEMTYYGAKVIHPKTIKPLENKNIPLYVKSFIEPTLDGTLISSMDGLMLPPIIVTVDDQTLIHISSNDFSFIGEKHLGSIFTLLAKHHLKINMMQNTAISFSVCTRQNESRIKSFVEELGSGYSVIRDKDLELITIRHFNEETVEQMKRGTTILFEERLRDTIQMVVKAAPLIKRRVQ